MKRARDLLDEPRRNRPASRYAFAWVAESFEDDPSHFEKPMFGCHAHYVGGRLVLVRADRGAPWQGLLVPTEAAHHAALQAQFPALRVHPVLRKWLLLGDEHPEFEATALALAARIKQTDPRIGVEPSEPRRAGFRASKGPRKRPPKRGRSTRPK